MQLISGISVYLASSEVCESVCKCVCECVFVCLSACVCLWICLRLFVDWASLTAAHLLTVPSRERGSSKGEGGGRRHAVCSQATHLLQELYLILHLGERVGCASVPQRRTSFNCNICLNVAR